MHEPSPTPAAASLDNPPSLSALELHEILLKSHASLNRTRKRFIDALRALYDSELYLQLGFPNIAAYAEATFSYRHARTHEFIDVSRALLCLPGITAAFEQGAISFHLTSRLSGVATAETEREWLAFLEGRRVKAVLHEIEQARSTKRKSPRQGSFGLPGLPVKVTFELSPEEHAIYEKAMEKTQSEIAPRLGGERLEPKDVLLVLCRRLLETEPEGSMTRGRKETGLSPFTVVIHQCPDCARGALDTKDGPVELEPGALERIASEAEAVVPEETAPSSKDPVPPGERDRPNSPALRKAVCQRHGGRCANPCCNRLVEEDGQAHHLKARALGGRTELENEAWLCCLCHALAHSGKLIIEGDPVRGLIFRPAAMSVTSAIRKELEAIRELPVVRTVEAPRAFSGPPEKRDDLSLAQAALEKLGFGRREARRRLEIGAGCRGGDAAVTTEALVKEALRL